MHSSHAFEVLFVVVFFIAVVVLIYPDTSKKFKTTNFALKCTQEQTLYARGKWVNQLRAFAVVSKKKKKKHKKSSFLVRY